jgi:RNA polymerase sigma factor (sigma-70 family)
MNDIDLIVAIKLGDTSVLEHCYEHLPTVKKFVLINSGSDADAYDLFQEVIMAFYKNAIKEDFKLTASLNTYLMAIGKNIWMNKLRREDREKVFFENFKNEKENSESLSSDIELEDYRLSKVFENLQEPCISILKKYYFQNMKFKAIAENMGYSSEKVAKQQKYKCLKNLKIKLSSP